MTYLDLFHSYISWGVFPDNDVVSEGWRYSAIATIAEGEKALDEIVSQLPKESSCLLEALEDSSILNTVMTDHFSGNFSCCIRNVSMALKSLLQSDQTADMVQLIYELARSEIRAIDYNALQPTLYYFVLQLKTLLMNPDFTDLFSALNQTDYFIQESFWKFISGRWTEMERFVDNFLRRTVGSIVFWDRLTGQFITELENKMKDWLRKNDLLENIDPFIEKLIFLMDRIADGDEVWIRNVFKDIRGSQWDEGLTSYIEIIGEELTRLVMLDLFCN